MLAFRELQATVWDNNHLLPLSGRSLAQGVLIMSFFPFQLSTCFERSSYILRSNYWRYEVEGLSKTRIPLNSEAFKYALQRHCSCCSTLTIRSLIDCQPVAANGSLCLGLYPGRCRNITNFTLPTTSPLFYINRSISSFATTC